MRYTDDAKVMVEGALENAAWRAACSSLRGLENCSLLPRDYGLLGAYHRPRSLHDKGGSGAYLLQERPRAGERCQGCKCPSGSPHSLRTSGPWGAVTALNTLMEPARAL